MKIGFDAKRAFANSSGLGNHSRNTLNALNEYFHNHQYILFSPSIKNDFFINHNLFETISPKNSSAKLYKAFWRTYLLSGQLKKWEIDIFHGLSNELPKGIHKNKILSIVTVHDLIFLRFPEFYKPIDRKIYFRKVKYACNFASKIIAISQQTKDDIVNFLKISPEKIEVIHQSISPVFFEKNNTKELILKYNLPEKFILSVGTIERRKNQITLLRSIHSEKIKLPIVFVGNQTPYFKSLQKFISTNKMENQVKFLNNIPEYDLAGLYQLASLSVYNSVFEGFGLPVIESMACGCPVITSNVSCLPETGGDAAVLCDPNNHFEIRDQIINILENETFRNNLIQLGSERAKLFHPKIYAEKLISLYSEILNR